MPEWMRDFLRSFAAKQGHSKEEIRWAAEECIKITARQPEFADCLSPDGKAALGVKEKKAEKAPAKTEKPKAKAPAKIAKPLAKKAKTEKPKAKTEKPKAKAEKAKAEKAKADKTDIKGKPTALKVGGSTSEVGSWRGALLLLVERVISAGKSSDLPESWVKGEASRKVSATSDGRFFYTTLNSKTILLRLKSLATILGEKVTLTCESADGDKQVMTLA
jgi:hypothetical protein